MKKTKRLLAEVVEHQEICENLLVLAVRPAQPLSFEPGQYVKLFVDGITRRYSIVSAPHEEVLEFCIERVPGGEMTGRLWDLRRGDMVGVRTKVKGKLQLDLRVPSHLMIATVTGISPFVSMLRAYLHEERQGHNEERQGHTFYLLHGARCHDEFPYLDELTHLAALRPNLLKYVPAISRPAEAKNAGWAGETGRVSGLIAKYVAQYGLDPRSTLLYACGHPDMVKEVKKRYGRDGFQVDTERYWKT